MDKRLGKIKSVSFGFGGYQDAQIGISFDLGGDGWDVGDFWGQWATEHTNYCKWTHEERITGLGETCWRIKELLETAKVDDVTRLKGIPIEVTFEGSALKEWRLLTEVI